MIKFKKYPMKKINKNEFNTIVFKKIVEQAKESYKT